ncbi:MAG: DNA polymerase IV [Spirochaetia bacterium]|nr:DNA polymerase IV [Spirochaetia bacterium]
MDAFYAAVEQRDNPEYRGKPVIIGADPKQGRGRGVVSTASYEARKFGVKSAMPISQAYARCPQGIYVPPRMERYAEASSQVFAVLREFSPLVEPLSIDEAFLDLTGTEALLGKPLIIGQAIKDEIKRRTDLTASVGLAPNKYIAKVASDLRKPDGLVLCEPGREAAFLHGLPLERLWGVGPKTASLLRTRGFQTIGDVSRADAGLLARILGSRADHVRDLANGVDDRDVSPGWERKSISEETTFERDVDDANVIEATLGRLAETLGGRLRAEALRGRTVVLKVRLTPFDTFTRRRSLPQTIAASHDIRNEAIKIWRGFDRQDRSVRLVGVGLANLEKEAVTGEQGEFTFEKPGENRRESAEKAADAIRGRLGDKVRWGGFSDGLRSGQ